MNFTDYDKITDTLMFFNQQYQLNIVVQLNWISKSNKINPFHSEYKYKKDGRTCYSIKRDINVSFEIKDRENYEDSVYIKPKDMILFNMMIQDQVITWYRGSTRIYSFDNNNKLRIRKKFTPAEFPLSDYKFIRFIPIVIDYDDNTSKEGVRLIINHDDNYVDLEIGRFMEFVYYITNIDLYNAASSMLNYVKTAPYGTNMIDMEDQFRDDSYQDTKREKRTGKGYFDK